MQWSLNYISYFPSLHKLVGFEMPHGHICHSSTRVAQKTFLSSSQFRFPAISLLGSLRWRRQSTSPGLSTQSHEGPEEAPCLLKTSSLGKERWAAFRRGTCLPWKVNEWRKGGTLNSVWNTSPSLYRGKQAQGNPEGKGVPAADKEFCLMNKSKQQEPTLWGRIHPRAGYGTVKWAGRGQGWRWTYQQHV